MKLFEIKRNTKSDLEKKIKDDVEKMMSKYEYNSV